VFPVIPQLKFIFILFRNSDLNCFDRDLFDCGCAAPGVPQAGRISFMYMNPEIDLSALPEEGA
jgi:hypothetical protein